jgi:dCTP deaminase
MLKNDSWLSTAQIISPYVSSQVRQEGERKVISYGQSSYGYDIRLSPEEFYVFRPGLPTAKETIDPKDFDREILHSAKRNGGLDGELSFVMPPYSYALGVSLEHFKMPANVTGIALGKSTYARAGLITNLTPLEAGWVGHLTLEFANPTPRPLRLYANEGIAQILFFEGEPCLVNYASRNGKYQGQDHKVVLAQV